MAHSNPHFFIALPLPVNVRELLRKRANQLQDELFFKQWPDPLDYHLTLVFLGAIGTAQIDNVKKSMADVSKHFNSFTMQLDRLGAFGKKEQPRILWAGVSVDKGLFDLQRKVHEACCSIGFELDRRPYKPHITLAKKWNSKQTLNRSTFDDHLDDISWPVDGITLYQTHLRQVPKYEAVDVFPFGTP